ncbi:hypothetical protein BU14_0446s0004 [Porphyra umbilicalis]|uniref:Uncharacterized protein n=1 Tax=Porphyra umbilicalis TaxID=2786 RepID=A0A1X6NUM0_PORUM|nr:hypothetical protein BU14_0446s0004 [Porphyra umbilicalis]|eukprot:OSX72308.1 hypothetical protein BU14_0446s0004 [Porphyra umbilicalis]
MIEALRSGGAGLPDADGGGGGAVPPVTLYRAGWATNDGDDGDGASWRGPGLGGKPTVGAHLVLPGSVVRVGQLLRLHVAGGDVHRGGRRAATATAAAAASDDAAAKKTAAAPDADAGGGAGGDAATAGTPPPPPDSTAAEWAAALSVLGLEAAARAVDGWVPVGGLAFCRDGLAVRSVVDSMAGRLGLPPAAVVGLVGGAGGAVGNVGGGGGGGAVTAVTAAAVSYVVVYARAGGA